MVRRSMPAFSRLGTTASTGGDLFDRLLATQTSQPGTRRDNRWNRSGRFDRSDRFTNLPPRSLRPQYSNAWSQGRGGTSIRSNPRRGGWGNRLSPEEEEDAFQQLVSAHFGPGIGRRLAQSSRASGFTRRTEPTSRRLDRWGFNTTTTPLRWDNRTYRESGTTRRVRLANMDPSTIGRSTANPEVFFRDRTSQRARTRRGRRLRRKVILTPGTSVDEVETVAPSGQTSVFENPTTAWERERDRRTREDYAHKQALRQRGRSKRRSLSKHRGDQTPEVTATSVQSNADTSRPERHDVSEGDPEVMTLDLTADNLRKRRRERKARESTLRPTTNGEDAEETIVSSAARQLQRDAVDTNRDNITVQNGATLDPQGMDEYLQEIREAVSDYEAERVTAPDLGGSSTARIPIRGQRSRTSDADQTLGSTPRDLASTTAPTSTSIFTTDAQKPGLQRSSIRPTARKPKGKLSGVSFKDEKEYIPLQEEASNAQSTNTLEADDTTSPQRSTVQTSRRFQSDTASSTTNVENANSSLLSEDPYLVRRPSRLNTLRRDLRARTSNTVTSAGSTSSPERVIEDSSSDIDNVPTVNQQDLKPLSYVQRRRESRASTSEAPTTTTTIDTTPAVIDTNADNYESDSPTVSVVGSDDEDADTEAEIHDADTEAEEDDDSLRRSMRGRRSKIVSPSSSKAPREVGTDD